MIELLRSLFIEPFLEVWIFFGFCLFLEFVWPGSVLNRIEQCSRLIDRIEKNIVEICRKCSKSNKPTLNLLPEPRLALDRALDLSPEGEHTRRLREAENAITAVLKREQEMKTVFEDWKKNVDNYKRKVQPVLDLHKARMKHERGIAELNRFEGMQAFFKAFTVDFVANLHSSAILMIGKVVREKTTGEKVVNMASKSADSIPVAGHFAKAAASIYEYFVDKREKTEHRLVSESIPKRRIQVAETLALGMIKKDRFFFECLDKKAGRELGMKLAAEAHQFLRKSENVAQADIQKAIIKYLMNCPEFKKREKKLYDEMWESADEVLAHMRFQKFLSNFTSYG